MRNFGNTGLNIIRSFKKALAIAYEIAFLKDNLNQTLGILSRISH
jgi:capsular polysaccharide biosynthesis protein